jgi:hypothetical protein
MVEMPHSSFRSFDKPALRQARDWAGFAELEPGAFAERVRHWVPAFAGTTT